MREYRYDHVHLRSSDDRVQVDHNHEPCRLRERTRLGDAAGLTQYGVNLMRLPPGAWSRPTLLSRSQGGSRRKYRGAPATTVRDRSSHSLRYSPATRSRRRILPTGDFGISATNT